MNRRSFLVSSSVSAVSYGLPVSLSLMTAPALSAAATRSVGQPLPVQPSAQESLFRLHNWESDPEHSESTETTALFISLSTNWKASWL